MLLRLPHHLHPCVRALDLSKMESIIDPLFDDPQSFFQEWGKYETDVVAALEVVNIVSFAAVEEIQWNTGKIRNWQAFVELAACLALAELANPAILHNPQKFAE